jgi:hypothetical protein
VKTDTAHSAACAQGKVPGLVDRHHLPQQRSICFEKRCAVGLPGVVDQLAQRAKALTRTGKRSGNLVSVRYVSADSMKVFGPLGGRGSDRIESLPQHGTRLALAFMGCRATAAPLPSLPPVASAWRP